MRTVNEQTIKNQSIVKDEFTMWSYIKHNIEVRGLTFGKIARKLEVNKKNLTRVKRESCPKYERIIADILGMQPWDLWPERYDAAHNPNRISSRYPGHKHFLNNNQNKPKVNGKNQRRNCHETKG